MTTDTFAEHCRELAQRFLQTAIVVDDEAFAERNESPVDTVVAPGRRSSGADESDQPVRSGGHSLNTKAIIDGFATLGVICGAIGPDEAAMAAIRQADIVVLDWRLKADDPEFALSLLLRILTEEPDRNALRLVTFYTGEAELARIQDDIVSKLKEEGLDPRVIDHGTVTYGHGRIVLYAKPAVNLAEPFQGRQVAEDELPARLVEDFSRVTAGLLPSIALASLTAVRECAHKVLDRFRAELDPAFLAHRACLPDPDDAERQMVNHVAEELRGLMDYAVADQEPAGRQPITRWITERASQATDGFQFGTKPLSSEQAATLAVEGLGASVLRDNEFESLSSGFNGGNAEGLDERLAWIITSRTVFNAPPPRLWLGTVVRVVQDKDNAKDLRLICLRPRCDSVRLKHTTSFAFLPVGEPGKGQVQLIVRSEDGYQRCGVALDASGWTVREFEPDDSRNAVVARPADETTGRFVFTDTGGRQYEWLGELKAEFAHRIAQVFADALSRVAVDDSEWLRRSARK